MTTRGSWRGPERGPAIPPQGAVPAREAPVQLRGWRRGAELGCGEMTLPSPRAPRAPRTLVTAAPRPRVPLRVPASLPAARPVAFSLRSPGGRHLTGSRVRAASGTREPGCAQLPRLGTGCGEGRGRARASAPLRRRPRPRVGGTAPSLEEGDRRVAGLGALAAAWRERRGAGREAAAPAVASQTSVFRGSPGRRGDRCPGRGLSGRWRPRA